MKNILLPLCELIILFNAVNADYFWRDYYGYIPVDAVEGGTDPGGNVTYIGQTFYPKLNALLPATIYRNDRFAYLGFNPPIKSDKYTKVLCSHNMDDLKWIRTNITHMHSLTDCNQIIGGYYDGAIIVLGRVNYQGNTYIGKVYDHKPKKWHGIIFRDINDNHLELPEFEVLTYGCKKRFFTNFMEDFPR